MMSESNADGMMNPEPEREVVELEKLRKSVEELTRQVARLEERRKPDSLGWDDIAQEIVGAITFALPFIFTGEVWDVAKDISVERSLAIFLMTIGLAYLFLTKAQLGNLKREEIFHVPKRLITVALISYAVSAVLIYLFGIDYIAHFDAVQYFNATVIISTFAVIGAIAVDMVR
ncbi:putative membrane protein [Thermococcus nautili]|uniref:Putative membrane protein n=2 Tax=Thermococcus nautili TaxID=195522 RepID=W8NWR5_9EURY|nr:putative membrane protein [Thermococcus nautili]